MAVLHISEKFLLTAFNDKGKISSLNISIPICTLAAGIIDLYLDGCLVIHEDHSVELVDDLCEEHSHLQSLYQYLQGAKGKKIQKITKEYTMSVSTSRIRKLTKDIVKSLMEKECGTVKKNILKKNKTLFISNKNEIQKIIYDVKESILEQDQASVETFALASLLDKSALLKPFLSKEEIEAIKNRIAKEKKQTEDLQMKTALQVIDEVMTVFSDVTGFSKNK
ncbi:MAG TPA: hypothetical protein DHN33_07485 [Eubacteriaceae bacterium]|nr:hypothetical protein [Eubacteriaceae bacterium]